MKWLFGADGWLGGNCERVRRRHEPLVPFGSEPPIPCVPSTAIHSYPLLSIANHCQPSIGPLRGFLAARCGPPTSLPIDLPLAALLYQRTHSICYLCTYLSDTINRWSRWSGRPVMFNVSMDLSMLCSHCDLRNQAWAAVIMFREVSSWDWPTKNFTANT